jgi:hypothetical protein
MNNEHCYQPMLFSKMESCLASQVEYQKYQIKNLDDPTFGVTIIIKEDEDPEIVALEKLGYFVLPETTIQ